MRNRLLMSALAALGACAATPAGAPPAEPDAALLAQNYALLAESLCPAASGETPFPPRYSQGDPYIAPMQVFDNLYFLGTRVDTAWALTTSEGIILFDAMFPYEIEPSVIEAMPAFGLDPADIKYVVISHGHADHFGGAALLQERYGAKVVMSNTDWHLLPQPAESTPVPRRDVTVLDGDSLTLGDATVRFVETPGHTPGTLSALIPVRDGEDEHLAALWGGTAMNFASPEDVEVYQRSLAKFRTIDPAVDVVLSNHAYADGAELKMAAQAERGPGDPHPWVVGNAAFQDWLDVIEGCSEQWLAVKRAAP
jgi:metallo-beta-lactamase class B